MKSTLVVFTALAASILVAGEVTWKGDGASQRWSDGSNWVGGTPPGSGDIAVIPSNTTAYASHHTDANGGDLTTINALGGMRIEGDGRVEIDYEQDGDSKTCCFAWNVPLYGTGTFVMMNGVNNDRYLRMNVDNSAFQGSFLVSNALMRVKNLKGLGNSPVTLTANNSNNGLIFETSGVYSNDVVALSDGSNSPKFAGSSASLAVTNLGSVTVLSGRVSPNNITLLGGVYNQLSGIPALQAVMCGTVHIGGAGAYGTLQITGSQTLYVDAPLYPAEGNAEYEIFNNNADTFLTMCGSYLSDKCVLNMGTTHDHGTKFDMGGFDQTIKTLKFGTSRNEYDTNVPNQEITSDKPAKLTFTGTQSSEGPYFYGVLTGRASLEMSPDMPKGLWFPIGSVGNTTRGSILVRGGNLRLMPRCVFTRLSLIDIDARGKNKYNPMRALFETSAVNPGKLELKLSGEYATLEIAEGVQMDVKTFTLDGEYVMPGVYGSADAHEAHPDLVDEDHVIGRMQGLGTMRVRLSGPPGAVLIFR